MARLVAVRDRLSIVRLAEQSDWMKDLDSSSRRKRFKAVKRQAGVQKLDQRIAQLHARLRRWSEEKWRQRWQSAKLQWSGVDI